jgi:hypothetical protein
LYIYVDNNPLKYRDPTGHFPLCPLPNNFRVVKCALLQPKYSTFFDLPYKRLCYYGARYLAPWVFAAFAKDVGADETTTVAPKPNNLPTTLMSMATY